MRNEKMAAIMKSIEFKCTNKRQDTDDCKLTMSLVLDAKNQSVYNNPYSFMSNQRPYIDIIVPREMYDRIEVGAVYELPIPVMPTIRQAAPVEQRIDQHVVVVQAPKGATREWLKKLLS
jgi:hypothetical protein